MSAFKLVISLLFIVFSLFITTPVFAQTATPSAMQNYQLSQYTRYTDNLFIGLMHTVGCLAFGSSIVNQPCLTPLQSSDSKAQSNGGLLGFVTNTIVTLYANPPLRTTSYLADIKKNLLSAKPVYAQVGGSGQGVIEPIKTLWEASRNIAYIIMIIIFVVIGLMIMFRAKINPQTVISVQAALPGLVIGLILITFSYFIAALLVDVAFISTWIVGYYFLISQGGTNIVNTISQNFNVLTLFAHFIDMDNASLIDANTRPLVDTLLASNAAGAVRIVIAFLFAQVTSPISSIPFVGAAVGIGGIAGAFRDPPAALTMVLWVIIAFILLYTLIRLLLRLVTNYIMILLLTFTAPFTFLFASLPGRQGLIIDWIRNMLCNVLAFPAVFAAFYFAAYLIYPDIQSNPFIVTSGITFGPSTQPLPLMNNLDINFIRFLLAFGVLLATPSIPDVICNTIGTSGRPGSQGAVIGKQIEGGIQGGQGYTKTIQGGGGAIGSSVGGLFKK